MQKSRNNTAFNESTEKQQEEKDGGYSKVVEIDLTLQRCWRHETPQIPAIGGKPQLINHEETEGRDQKQILR